MKRVLFLCFILPSFAFSMIGLSVGDRVPRVKVKEISGKEIDLSKLKKETVIVFYRGSWCPYCVKQLKSIETDLKASTSADILAISVDQLKVAKKMKNKFKFSFGIVSDSKAKILKAFKLANKVSDELVAKYKSSYQIDIEADSGEKHHLIAHPGVFIIKNSRVTFADVHTNYKVRTDNKEILKALGK